MKIFVSISATVPSEYAAAISLLDAVSGGGIPLNPMKLRVIAENLGLEIRRTDQPEAIIGRIRAAVANWESQNPVVAPTTHGDKVDEPAASPKKTRKPREKKVAPEATVKRAAKAVKPQPKVVPKVVVSPSVKPFKVLEVGTKVAIEFDKDDWSLGTVVKYTPTGIKIDFFYGELKFIRNGKARMLEIPGKSRTKRELTYAQVKELRLKK